MISSKFCSDIYMVKLDKFYTLPEVAKGCIQLVSTCYNWKEWDLVLEPSAGNGSFLLQIPTQNRIGIDIAPDHEQIQEQDFFAYTPPENAKRIMVIGNPPFGKCSSLAVKFFQHASKWADVIAFIVPRTFRRISIQNKLNPYFHLRIDMEIPNEPCAFTPPMMAKCCFQVWERKTTRRNYVELVKSHRDWNFLPFGEKDSNHQPTVPSNPDFAIRAYGGKCGEIVIDGLNNLRPKSWHWISSNIEKNELIRRFRTLDYSICQETARQNSIGRGELVKLYMESFG